MFQYYLNTRSRAFVLLSILLSHISKSRKFGCSKRATSCRFYSLRLYCHIDVKVCTPLVILTMTLLRIYYERRQQNMLYPVILTGIVFCNKLVFYKNKSLISLPRPCFGKHTDASTVYSGHYVTSLNPKVFV